MHYFKTLHKYYKSEDLTDEELSVYLCLLPQLLTANYTDRVVIATEALAYTIYGTDCVRRKRNTTGAALSSLYKKGIITGEIIHDGLYFIDTIPSIDRDYVLIPYEAIIQLMRSAYKNKYQLIRYLCWLLDSRFNGSVVGNQKMSYFATMLNVSESTIMRYNENLEELKIIHIRRETGNDGKANAYGLYEDRHEVDEWADRQNYGKSNKSNWLRSVSGRYNWLVKNPDQVTEEDIVNFKEYNDYCRKRKGKEAGWEKRELDIDIFNDVG